jgi:flagellar hook-associated protein 1 FlgK
MSILGALSIGQTGLAVAQAQIQTTGNNIANVDNPDYTREQADATSGGEQQVGPGLFVGNGVDLSSISRQIDESLETRIRAANSDASAASTSSDWLGRIQSSFDELSDNDLSTQMSNFFNSWSTLANQPQDQGQRQVVIQSGEEVANTFQSLRSSLTGLQGDVNSQIKSTAAQADQLASQIAQLNGQIVTTEGGSGGTANTLRDQRDADLKQLSSLMNVQTVQQPTGAVDVYVGSDALVSDTFSRGVTVQQNVTNGQTTNGLVTSSLAFKSNNGTMTVTGGQLGGLMGAQTQINDTVDHLDTLAHSLIFELNKVHASGQGLQGFSSVTSTSVVQDPTAALDGAQSGLKFTPNNGSFVVHVTQPGSGIDTSTLVPITLGGAGGTSLNSLAASLSAINGVSATVNGGKLTISAANPNTQISFSQDSSGVLAALGVNNFYTGSDARDIAVSQTIQNDPSLIAAAKNGQPADNQTARAIADLESTAVSSLNGSTLKDTYQSVINGLAAQTSAAKSSAEATQSVSDTLEAQRDSLSGVSLDEETMNLLKQQRAYQGAAKLISTIDQMMQTLLTMT